MVFDKEKLQHFVTESIAQICRTKLHVESDFSVAALIGITICNDTYLVNIHENFNAVNNGLCINGKSDVEKSPNQNRRKRRPQRLVEPELHSHDLDDIEQDDDIVSDYMHKPKSMKLENNNYQFDNQNASNTADVKPYNYDEVRQTQSAYGLTGEWMTTPSCDDDTDVASQTKQNGGGSGSKGPPWSEPETWALLNVWREYELDHRLKNAHGNSRMFPDISRHLRDDEQMDRSAYQCRMRLSFVRRKYKQYKSHLELGISTKEGTLKLFPYFDFMDQIYGSGLDLAQAEDGVDRAQGDLGEV